MVFDFGECTIGIMSHSSLSSLISRLDRASYLAGVDIAGVDDSSKCTVCSLIFSSVFSFLEIGVIEIDS